MKTCIIYWITDCCYSLSNVTEGICSVSTCFMQHTMGDKFYDLLYRHASLSTAWQPTHTLRQGGRQARTHAHTWIVHPDSYQVYPPQPSQGELDYRAWSSSGPVSPSSPRCYGIFQTGEHLLTVLWLFCYCGPHTVSTRESHSTTTPSQSSHMYCCNAFCGILPTKNTIALSLEAVENENK